MASSSETEELSQQARQQDRAWRRYVERLREAAAPPPFEEQWQEYLRIFSDRPQADGPPAVWWPGPEQLQRSNPAALLRQRGLRDYRELHRWSVEDRPGFWEVVIRRLGVVLQRQPEAILDPAGGVEQVRWLPGARLSCVDTCFNAAPDSPALVLGDESSDELRSVSYGELSRLVDRVAHGLRRAGFGEGDGLALYMPMNLECVAAYLGAVKAGCRVISIADSFPPAEVARRLEIGEAHGVVTVASFTRAGKTFALYDKVLQAGAPQVIVVPAAAGGAAPDLRGGDLSWDDFLGPDEPFPGVAGDPERVINVLFSSGTTSTPKAIPWTQLTPIKCAMDGHLHQDIRPGDVVAWPTNIGWMMGPWLVFAGLINRATVALYEGAPTGEGFARFVERAGVTMLGLVPSLARAWRTTGAADAADWSGVRVFSSTGEPSSVQDYLWLMSRTGYRAPVVEYCGGTEIGGGHITGSVLQPASPAAFTTPALGLDFVLLDDEGREVGPGQMGQLYLVPPSVGLSQRLLNKDHHQVYYADCPPGPAGQVLRRHGDQVKRLGQGYFKAHGRADDAMNLGGIKVGSPEIERVLDGHPAVYESAAVAVQPEGEGADRLVLFVVAEGQPDRAELQAELGRLLARQLNPLFKVHDLVLVQDLPRTASNKLMRRTLRTRYMVSDTPT
jgi:acetyl-CoA synthetase